VPHEDILARIASAVAAGEHRVTYHAAVQYLEESDRPSVTQAEAAVLDPDSEVIEWRPDNPRGPTCLVRSAIHGRVVHVLCSYPPPACTIISFWWPDTEPEKWSADFRRRA
jgi:hypothetical protein